MAGHIAGGDFNGITGLADAAPLPNGAASVGTSSKVAREDHVHPGTTIDVPLSRDLDPTAFPEVHPAANSASIVVTGLLGTTLPRPAVGLEQVFVCSIAEPAVGEQTAVWSLHGFYSGATVTNPVAGLSLSIADRTPTTRTTLDITVQLKNDLLALESLTGTGFAKRTATDTWTLVNLSFTDISGVASPSQLPLATTTDPGVVQLARDLDPSVFPSLYPPVVPGDFVVTGLFGSSLPVPSAGNQLLAASLAVIGPGQEEVLWSLHGFYESCSITVPNGLTATVGNASPVSGSPLAITLGLNHDLAALEALSGSGFAKRTGTDTWVLTSLAFTDIGGVATAAQLPSLDGITAPAADVSANLHKITNLADPSGSLDAVNLQTLLSYIQGLDAKPQVAYCSTAPLPANTYSNGTSGVGATLTGTSNGALVIDGVTLAAGAAGKKVLIAGEATASHNGWYEITQVGDGTHPYILTRSTGSDQAAEIAPGYLTAVECPTGLTAGTSNNQRVFISIAPSPFVVGTDSVTFAVVGATYQAGTNLTLSGNTFSLSATYPGQSSIVTVGTVTSGTWNATKIGLAYGGTNADLSATGGASKVLMQTTLGGAVTVAQLAYADISGLASMAQQSAASVAITGGNIDGTAIGSTTRAAAKFTTLDANGAATFGSTVQVTGTFTATVNAILHGGATVDNAQYMYWTDTSAANRRVLGLNNTNDYYVGMIDTGWGGNLNLYAGTGVNISINRAGATPETVMAISSTGVMTYTGRVSQSETYTDTSGTVVNGYFHSTLDPTATSSVTHYAARGELTVALGNTQTFSASLYGGIGYFSHNGTGQVSGGIGLYGLSASATGITAPITTAVGVRGQVNNAGNGVITTAIALQALAASNGGSGSITTGYGLKVEDQSAATTNYAIYTGVGLVRFGDTTVATTFGNGAVNLSGSKTGTVASTATSGSVYGDITKITTTPGAASSTISYGGYFEADFAGAGTNNGSLVVGVKGVAQHTGTSTLTSAIGGRFIAGNTNASGTLSGAYGVYIDAPLTTGTVTTAYGLYINSQSGGGTNYAIYTNSGTVRLGDATLTTFSSTVTSGTVPGYQSNLVANPSGATSAQFIGIQSTPSTNSGNANNFTATGVGGLCGISAQPTHSASGTLTRGVGVNSTVNTGSAAGAVTDFIAYRAILNHASTSTITNGYGYRVETFTNTGGGAITNLYGIKVEDQTAGATNYAFYSGAGFVYHKDSVGIKVTPTLDQALRVGGTLTGTSTTQIGVASNTIPSTSATSSYLAAYFVANSAAAAYTVASIEGLRIGSGVIGAGSTVSTVYGLRVLDQTGGGTNYAIYTGLGKVRFGDAVTGTSSILSSSPTAGMGYATGAGGTVTQATSKSTGVTLNCVCGEITLNAANLAGDTTVSFVLTNSAIAATDVLVLNHVSGGTFGSYSLNGRCAAGSATIDVHNVTTGALAEAIVIRYAVVKAVTA